MRAEKQYLIARSRPTSRSPTTSSSRTFEGDRRRHRRAAQALAPRKAEFHVVKNSSLRVAAKALGLPEFEVR
jgi:large subunit ribosomal protein L10